MISQDDSMFIDKQALHGTWHRGGEMSSFEGSNEG